MRYFFAALVVVVLFGGFYYGDAMREAPATLAGNFKSAVALPFLALKNFFGGRGIARELAGLRLENQRLEAQLFAARIGAPENSPRMIAVKVHAAYPFNNKSTLTIAAGSEAGIAVGAVALADKDLFLGEVVETHDGWSVVRTVFDPSRELPVRIGSSGTLGLLRGGTTLTVSLVPKARAMNAGDEVYTASKELPYGLRIGIVRATFEDPAGAFKSADVAPAYVVGDLERVYVLTGKSPAK